MGGGVASSLDASLNPRARPSPHIVDSSVTAHGHTAKFSSRLPFNPSPLTAAGQTPRAAMIPPGPTSHYRLSEPPAHCVQECRERLTPAPRTRLSLAQRLSRVHMWLGHPKRPSLCFNRLARPPAHPADPAPYPTPSHYHRFHRSRLTSPRARRACPPPT